MTTLTPDAIRAIEAEARALRAREIGRLAASFGAVLRRLFGRSGQTRAA